MSDREIDSVDEPGRGALSDKMLDTIRASILRGKLHFGQHLSQSGLAEQHAVSKVPVREALKQLHAEGLVDHDRNRGYFVARPSREEALQLYRMRRWLEADLLRTARWPDAEELARLRGLEAQVARPITSDSYDEWIAALTEMRFRIFDLSSEKIILREARRLWNLTDRFRALLPASASPTGESRLIDALEVRDRDSLLNGYREDRDRIETLVAEALEDFSDGWL